MTNRVEEKWRTQLKSNHANYCAPTGLRSADQSTRLRPCVATRPLSGRYSSADRLKGLVGMLAEKRRTPVPTDGAGVMGETTSPRIVVSTV